MSEPSDRLTLDELPAIIDECTEALQAQNELVGQAITRMSQLSHTLGRYKELELHLLDEKKAREMH